MQLLKNRSYLVAPQRRIDVAGDPDDNKFIECADVASADYLITGNRRHFPEFWKKTKIITPREFINIVAPNLIP
jgi:predicted nucleic acid-binding protein